MSHEAVDMTEMVDVIDTHSGKVTEALRAIKNRGMDVSIGDMFEMQLLMQKLSQLSEMSSAVQAGMHGAALSISRNLK